MTLRGQVESWVAEKAMSEVPEDAFGFCPLCWATATEPYIRRAWRSSWTACVVHRFPLRWRCHACGWIPSWSDLAAAGGLAACGRCAADLRQAPPCPVGMMAGKADRGKASGSAGGFLPELGTAFLYADLELTPEVRDDTASYIAWWLTALKNDNRAIFQAAAHAQRAVEFLQKAPAGGTGGRRIGCLFHYASGDLLGYPVLSKKCFGWAGKVWSACD